jgi:UDP-glucose 4-epimerase
MSRIIVTGGAGYIGGQTVLNLLDAGHSVLAIDRSLEPNHLMECGAKWLVADFSGEVALAAIKTFQPDAIVHCAGTSLVGPSIANPEEYYNNNFVKTKILLDFLIQQKIQCRFVFSSSAATYGNPIMTPCLEVDPAEPISPYGESKLMIEWMLRAYHRAYGLDYVAFRYFNACGADSQARHGQAAGATHIIARVLESMKSGTNNFVLNGTDFETPDGTCVRDYIHVEDLALAHIMAVSRLIPGDVYNLGTNQGYSNIQILHGAIAVTGHELDYTTGPRREGDPAMLTADASKFMNISSWKPQFGLEDIIRHAWAWYNR